MPETESRPARRGPHLAALAAVCACFAAYLALSVPNGLVVRPDGSIDGAMNVLRQQIQLQKFWTQQLAQAQAELAMARAGGIGQTVQVHPPGQGLVATPARHGDDPAGPALADDPATDVHEHLWHVDLGEADRLNRFADLARGHRIAKLRKTIDLISRRIAEHD
jgi:hypothetical protein